MGLVSRRWSGAGPQHPLPASLTPQGQPGHGCSHYPPSRAGEASPQEPLGQACRLSVHPAVEECQLDENSMLIPIAVGGALAGLVLIVLIAYLIGRKRSHAGYQTI